MYTHNTTRAYNATVLINLVDPRYMVKSLLFQHCCNQATKRKYRAPTINNLCAKAFLPAKIDINRFVPVSRQIRTDFGCVAEIFSVSCNISIKQDFQTILLKGGSDFEQVKRDLYLIAKTGDENIDMFVHLLVLSGCLGFNTDVSLGGLLENTITFLYKTIFQVQSRTEEASNHVELTSNFNHDVCRQLCHHLGDETLLYVCEVFPCDITLNMSVSRFGEMLFRLSFSSPVLYGKTQDTAVKDIVKTYMRLLQKIVSGKGWYH
eukprot:2824297-Rhodomonas_salina.2